MCVGWIWISLAYHHAVCTSNHSPCKTIIARALVHKIQPPSTHPECNNQPAPVQQRTHQPRQKISCWTVISSTSNLIKKIIQPHWCRTFSTPHMQGDPRKCVLTLLHSHDIPPNKHGSKSEPLIRGSLFLLLWKSTATRDVTWYNYYTHYGVIIQTPSTSPKSSWCSNSTYFTGGLVSSSTCSCGHMYSGHSNNANHLSGSSY